MAKTSTIVLANNNPIVYKGGIIRLETKLVLLDIIRIKD